MGAVAQRPPRSSVTQSHTATSRLLQAFGGFVKKYNHESTVLGCKMTFSVFHPPAAEKNPVPVRHHPRVA